MEIDRYLLSNALRAAADVFTKDAAETPYDRVKEQFTQQAEQCKKAADAIDDGEDLRLTG